MDETIIVNEHSIEYIMQALQFTLDTQEAYAEQQLDSRDFEELDETLNRWQSYLWAFEDICNHRTGREKDPSRKVSLLAVYKDRLARAKKRREKLA